MTLSPRIFRASLLFLPLLITGCGHHRRYQAPPPPAPAELETPVPFSIPRHVEPEPRAPLGPVLATENGVASWYGTYRNAHTADGRVYDENAYTAAHRLIPLGSLVRVTNLRTRQSVLVTITDRGPFVPGRSIDLSRAAALKIGVWRTGTARVRIEVLRYPEHANLAGRWCVQIGAFTREREAKQLHERLLEQYPTAHVIDFKGSTGYWVRIRPQSPTRGQAQVIATMLHPVEGEAYLVRLK